MATQTVTIYPEAVIGTGFTDAAGLLGYSTSGAAYRSQNEGPGTQLYRWGKPGFSGNETILEVRIYVEGRTLNAPGSQSTSSWLLWYFDGGATNTGVYLPPGNWPNSTWDWANSVYNASGATRSHQASSVTTPWGLRTGTPSLTIAAPNQWELQPHIAVYIQPSGYTGAVAYLRRARIEIDYIPGNVVHVKDGGVWKESTPYGKHSGVWKEGAPYAKHSGIWKPTV